MCIFNQLFFKESYLLILTLEQFQVSRSYFLIYYFFEPKSRNQTQYFKLSYFHVKFCSLFTFTFTLTVCFLIHFFINFPKFNQFLCVYLLSFIKNSILEMPNDVFQMPYCSQKNLEQHYPIKFFHSFIHIVEKKELLNLSAFIVSFNNYHVNF